MEFKAKAKRHWSFAGLAFLIGAITSALILVATSNIGGSTYLSQVMGSERFEDVIFDHAASVDLCTRVGGSMSRSPRDAGIAASDLSDAMELVTFDATVFERWSEKGLSERLRIIIFGASIAEIDQARSVVLKRRRQLTNAFRLADMLLICAQLTYPT